MIYWQEYSRKPKTVTLDNTSEIFFLRKFPKIAYDALQQRMFIWRIKRHWYH
jgi:hypothetical protein